MSKLPLDMTVDELASMMLEWVVIHPEFGFYETWSHGRGLWFAVENKRIRYSKPITSVTVASVMLYRAGERTQNHEALFDTRKPGSVKEAAESVLGFIRSIKRAEVAKHLEA